MARMHVDWRLDIYIDAHSLWTKPSPSRVEPSLPITVKDSLMHLFTFIDIPSLLSLASALSSAQTWAKDFRPRKE